MFKSQLVYKILGFIPKGKVLTYARLAELAGMPKGARAVGNVLHKNPDAPRVPCHRVVASDGRMGSNYALGGPAEQFKRLKEEGVVMIGDKVDLEKSLWHPPENLILNLTNL